MNPTRFGKYFLLEVIASGGMAEIYKAMVKTGERRFHPLAIKRILPQFSKDEEFISLLTDEAKVMVFLNHPNIVSIVEFGKIEGSYYIAMDYIDGTTLQALFRRIRELGDLFPIHIALYIVREIAAGLSYAHRKTDQSGQPLHLVHRDISPGNILLSFDGDIKITDFGISKVANQNHETQIGVIRGKTGYMSPEQTRAGIQIDSRTDLYALGIILYELVTGERLYKADSVPQALKLIREGKILPPSHYRAEIHPSLEAIIMKMLSQDPGQRYQTGEEIGDAINEFLTRLYSGSKKRVTHTDLIEFVSKYFDVSSKEERQAIHDSDERTLSNAEFDSKMERDDILEPDATSSKVYAVNPLFTLEAQQNEQAEEKKKPQEKTNTESLIHAPKGSMNSVPRDKQTRIKTWLVLGLAVSIGIWGAWQYFETKIVNFFRPSEVDVLVETNPSGANIMLDQLEWNQKSPARVKLIRGTDVQIIVSKEGYQRMARLITVDANNTVVKFDLEPQEPDIPIATVTIQSEPSGASVFIDEEALGQKTPYDLTLEVGREVNVRLELPGYKSRTATIKPDHEAKLVKNIILLKDSTTSNRNRIPNVKVKLPSLGRRPTKSGKRINLSVNTTPWSEVYLDGIKIGISPFVGVRVTQGTHRLRFVNTQLKIRPLEVRVNFTQDQQVRCIYDLNQRAGECK